MLAIFIEDDMRHKRKPLNLESPDLPTVGIRIRTAEETVTAAKIADPAVISKNTKPQLVINKPKTWEDGRK